MCSVPTPDEAASAASKSKCLDLATCTSSALANYLIQHRFHSDPPQALSFLQAATKAVTQHVKDQEAASESSQQRTIEDLGAALLSTPLETSLITPRAGKFQIQLHERGLVATKLNTNNASPNNIQLVLPQGSVSHILLFPKPEDCKTIVANNKKSKPPNAHLVLLRVEPPLQFQNKSVNQVCFALSWNKAEGPTGPAGETSGWKQATAAWRTLLSQSFGGGGGGGGGDKNNAVVAQVHPQPPSPFLSYQSSDQSTTTGGMPFVKCYHGVQDGVLYPLQEGLLFYKPLKFLPRSSLHSIACGRGAGGQNASRYVDLVVELAAKGETAEFSNIQREEVGVLNEYIQKILIPAMKADVKNSPKTNKDDGGSTEDDDDDDDSEEEEQDDEDDDSDEEDDNFEVEGDDDDGEEEDEESGDDDDDEFEVVQDDFAKELVKRSKNNEESGTESEEDEQPRSKRRRRLRSG